MNEALLALRTRPFDFSGRSSRREYWFSQLILILISFLGGLILGFLSASFNLSESTGLIMQALLTIIFTVPSLALTSRRLHDTGRSGWTMLLYLIPIIGSIIVLVYTLTPSSGPNGWGEPTRPAQPAEAGW